MFKTSNSGHVHKKPVLWTCLLLAAVLLLPLFVSCGQTVPDPDRETGQVPSGETGSSGHLGGDETETEEIYVPPVPDDPDGPVTIPDDGNIYVIYTVNNKMGGTLSGTVRQQITSTRPVTTVVTAKPNLGYKFVGWSDGKTEAKRSGDTADETVVLTALFDYDTLELPVLDIRTETGRDVESKTEYIAGTMSLFNAESRYAFSDSTIRIRGRGNNTWTYEKKSYKFKFDQKINLLGLGNQKYKTWVLLANMCDQSLLRNHTALYLGRSMSHLDWMPNSTSVEVYLNGEYRGVYLLAEEIEVKDGRVPVSDNPEAGTDIGFLFEMSVYTDHASPGFFQTGSRAYGIKSDLSSDPNLAQQQKAFLKDYINQCWGSIRSGSRERVDALIDIPSAVDAYIAEEILKNLDMGWDSFYFHKDAGGKLVFGPIWDFDLTLGNGNETCEYYTDLYCAIYRTAFDGNTMLSNNWFYALMTCDWFREEVADRYAELRESVFDHLDDFVTSNAKAGFKAYSRNFKKWPVFGKSMNRETELITSLKNYTEHYEYLAEWVQNRVDWLADCYPTANFLSGTFINYASLIAGWDAEPARVILPDGLSQALKGKTDLTPDIYDYQSTLAGFDGEGIDNAYDGNAATKYCVNVGTDLALRVFFDHAVTMEYIVLTTGNDTDKFPERNPTGVWEIFGTNDDSVGQREWIRLTSFGGGGTYVAQSGVRYAIETGLTQPYKYYKIQLHHEGVLQFAELEFYGKS